MFLLRRRRRLCVLQLFKRVSPPSFPQVLREEERPSLQLFSVYSCDDGRAGGRRRLLGGPSPFGARSPLPLPPFSPSSNLMLSIPPRRRQTAAWSKREDGGGGGLHLRPALGCLQFSRVLERGRKTAHACALEKRRVGGKASEQNLHPSLYLHRCL